MYIYVHLQCLDTYVCITINIFIYYYNIHRDGSNDTYGVTNMQYNAKDSESLNTYDNISLKVAPLSPTQQHIKPGVDNNMTIQRNPSYSTVDCSNPQVKPAAKDHVKIQRNPSYLTMDCSKPQVKPEADTDTEDDAYF